MRLSKVVAVEIEHDEAADDEKDIYPSWPKHQLNRLETASPEEGTLLDFVLHMTEQDHCSRNETQHLDIEDRLMWRLPSCCFPRRRTCESNEF
jgi:hypothetical protein